VAGIERVPGTACEPRVTALQFPRIRSFLDGCRSVEQAPRACSYPAPRGPSCPASRLLESRGGGLAPVERKVRVASLCGAAGYPTN